MGDHKSNFVFALGCLCKCMWNKLRLAAILFLCGANLPRFDARIRPHFQTQVPSLQHTNWHVDCTYFPFLIENRVFSPGISKFQGKQFAEDSQW